MRKGDRSQEAMGAKATTHLERIRVQTSGGDDTIALSEGSLSGGWDRVNCIPRKSAGHQHRSPETRGRPGATPTSE